MSPLTTTVTTSENIEKGKSPSGIVRIPIFVIVPIGSDSEGVHNLPANST